MSEALTMRLVGTGLVGIWGANIFSADGYLRQSSKKITNHGGKPHNGSLIDLAPRFSRRIIHNI